MTPTIGRIFLVQFHDRKFNGSDTHPAIVTAAHNEEYINARVLVDGTEVPWVTSVLRKDLAVRSEPPQDVWYWPPREAGAEDPPKA